MTRDSDPRSRKLGAIVAQHLFGLENGPSRTSDQIHSEYVDLVNQLREFLDQEDPSQQTAAPTVNQTRVSARSSRRVGPGVQSRNCCPAAATSTFIRIVLIGTSSKPAS